MWIKWDGIGHGDLVHLHQGAPRVGEDIDVVSPIALGGEG